jgi:acetyltransferase-like isoleucine patch superfamily enzyme
MVERKIWLIGAGGFAFDIANKFAKVPGSGNVFMGFIDSRDDEKKQTKLHCERIGLPAMLESPDEFDFTDSKNRYLFGIGEAKYKKEFTEKHGIKPEYFHRFEQAPSIDQNSEVLSGIYWGCNIASNVKVGYAGFIDTHSVLGHGVSVGNYSHIAVGVIIGGNTSIGDACFIHSGAIIGNNLKIGDSCTIGAGAVVVRDLPAGSTIIAPKSVVI